MQFKNVSAHNPCPVCGKADWCSISDGWCCCRRVDDGTGKHKEDKVGVDYWVYKLDGEQFPPSGQTPELPLDTEPKRADPATRHKVYSALLAELPLSWEHRDNLRKRGLPEEEIELRKYRTLPERGRAKIAKKLVEKYGENTCTGVPGLFVKQGDNSKYWTLAGAPGLLVPVRDKQGQITALKVRADDPGDGHKYTYMTSKDRKSSLEQGPGPGIQVHVPLTNSFLKQGLVRITEGELKADIAMALSGKLTISMPGVSTWRQVLPLLSVLDVDEVLLAFDIDTMTNQFVARAQRLTVQALEKEGYAVKVETWPSEYKGIDDALAAGVEIQVLEAGKAEEKIADDLKNAKVSAFENAFSELKNYPRDSKKLQECMHHIVSVESDVEREVLIERLKGITGISKKAIRADIERIRGELGQRKDETKETQAGMLIRMAIEGAFLFHDETKDGFASLEINEHREIHALNSKFFKRWIVRQYYKQTGHSPSSEAVRQALGVIEAKAVFDGPEYKLHLRVAKHDGAIWYDLANDAWQAVKITPDGWEVWDNPPILFRRFKNTAPQVLPERGGGLELMRKYINFKNNSDCLLSDAYDATSLISGMPQPIPIFYGDKGSAKTTAQRVKRKIIDPAYRDTMLLPPDKNELALMLMTNYAPIFDNLDGLQPWQSNMLCQAATGGGISKRELYTDIDEVILSFMRCPMLNGINLVASRDDLLDRSLLFKLERIDEESRMEEAEFWQEFEKDRPYILGALFDAVVAAMNIYPSVKLQTLPRMADFARWGYAVTQAISNNGEAFLDAYFQNIAGAVEEAVLSEQVSAAAIDFMSDKTEWEGTATELLKKLSEIPGVDIKAKSWPKRPHTLTKRLNKMEAALADYGIICETWRKGSSRSVSLRVKRKASQPSQASKLRENGGSDNDASESQASQKNSSVTQASLHEAREHGNPDGNDANDGCFRTPGESDAGCINNNDDDLKSGEI